MKLFANGGWRDGARGSVFVNGAWRTVTRVMAYAGGAWKTAVQFAPPLSVSLPTEYDVFVTGNPIGFGQAFVGATPSGGLAPFSYAWSIIGGSATPSASLGSPALASTAVNGGAYQSSVEYVQLSVTVTDAIGQTATGGTIVIFENIWGL